LITGSIADTARLLGSDTQAYEQLMTQPVRDWPGLAPDLLGPLNIPKHPLAYAQFGLKALPSAQLLADLTFKTNAGRGLWAGMAAHSMQPFTNLTTASVALVLLVLGHRVGWPLPRGGSQSIANALADYFVSLGGQIQTNMTVRSLGQLPSSHAVMLDITPRQVLAIAGERLSPLYRWQLNRYRYGMGIFKMDWALAGPIPFINPDCHRTGTVHIGGSLEEIAAGEQAIANGQHPERPFVLLAQQSRFDDTRAPQGQHTAWAYCHTPNGSLVDQTDVVERQIERFAPGFRERILARHVMNTAAVEAWNENYVGGDINGGVQDVTQLFTRPALRFSPYRTSAKGIYICSSATPPGGGVHGMGGYHAAQRALQDVFNQ
ncbi:MAG: dependent oxidoreductase, partial [Spirosoma sp.]|nr:dependent oxidoreductase [Spirosoma sp.]